MKENKKKRKNKPRPKRPLPLKWDLNQTSRPTISSRERTQVTHSVTEQYGDYRMLQA